MTPGVTKEEIHDIVPGQTRIRTNLYCKASTKTSIDDLPSEPLVNWNAKKGNWFLKDHIFELDCMELAIPDDRSLRNMGYPRSQDGTRRLCVAIQIRGASTKAQFGMKVVSPNYSTVESKCN